jgi:hypothetical protein
LKYCEVPKSLVEVDVAVADKGEVDCDVEDEADKGVDTLEDALDDTYGGLLENTLEDTFEDTSGGQPLEGQFLAAGHL